MYYSNQLGYYRLCIQYLLEFSRRGLGENRKRVHRCVAGNPGGGVWAYSDLGTWAHLPQGNPCFFNQARAVKTIHDPSYCNIEPPAPGQAEATQ